MTKLKTVLLVAVMLLSTLSLLTPVSADAPEPVDFEPMGTDRVVLFEQFTSGACGWCPQVCQALNKLEDDTGLDHSDVVILSYHGNMAGYTDPLTASETSTRMHLYGFGGYPSVAIDGAMHRVGGAGTADQIYQDMKNNYYTPRSNIDSELRLTIEGDLDYMTEKGDIWVNMTAIDEPSEDNLKLHVVVFENAINYNAPNGESVHNFVVREFLDGASGRSISISKGGKLQYHYQFDFPTYQDAEEVGVIAMVQTSDRTSSGNYYKAPVLQSAFFGIIPLPNVPPTISNGQVEVPENATEDDEVTFKVFYRDTDDYKNNGPGERNVIFKNGTSGSPVERELKTVPDGNPWTHGKWLAHTTKLPPGTYYYKFNVSDGEDWATGDTAWNMSNPFTILPRNKVPMLSNKGMAPTEGDTTTVFRFDIMYRDMDNEPAAEAKVFINGEAHDMETDSQGPWTEWQTYYHETTLDVGENHRYYFWFSDGEDSVRFPAIDESPNWFRGPYVLRPNNAPTLTTPLFSPKEGTRMDDFTFSIQYTDGENDRPIISYIYIDGVAAIMDGEGTNYQSGVSFKYKTKLELGEHTIRFLFSDGKNEVKYPAAGEIDGPVVINLDPEARISAPMDGVRYTPDDYVPFNAMDSEDPEGDELFYRWVSSIDGELSTSMAFDTPLSEGEHTITLTVTDAHDGSHSVSVDLLVKAREPHPFIVGIEASDESPVEGDWVTYTVTLDNDGEAKAEGLPIRFIVDNVQLYDDTVSVEMDAQQTITFRWQVEKGEHKITVEITGDSMEHTAYVDSNTPPAATPEIVNPSEDGKFKTGEEIYFKAMASDANEDDLTYEWDFGDGVTSTQENPSHIYADAGEYTVTVKITDERGDVTTKTLAVEITKPRSQDESPGFGAVVVATAMLAAMAAVAVRRRR